jgi:hypothetical protein
MKINSNERHDRIIPGVSCGRRALRIAAELSRSFSRSAVVAPSEICNHFSDKTAQPRRSAHQIAGDMTRTIRGRSRVPGWFSRLLKFYVFDSRSIFQGDEKPSNHLPHALIARL